MSSLAVSLKKMLHKNVAGVLLLLSPLFISYGSCAKVIDPDLDIRTPELIRSRGFLCEEHFVETEDGYILGIHRIVNPRIESAGRSILLWHGTMSSSRDFLINDGKGSITESTAIVGNNLGFELSKRSYDVWLGNSRGNTYSRNHTYLKTSSRKFWNFDSDEMIKYDLPNTIDYILQITGKQTVGYIGHSAGTTHIFGLLSSQEKYNRIVMPVIALAPVASAGKVAPHIRALSFLTPALKLLELYSGPLFPTSKLESRVTNSICSVEGIKDLCIAIQGLGVGLSFDLSNKTRYDVYISGFPAGISSRNLVHLAQSARTGTFRRYDFGLLRNKRLYSTFKPPDYKLEDITNNDIALFSSLNDYLATQANVDFIRRNLKVKLIEDYIIPFKRFNHLDFLLGSQAGRLINARIIDILNKYNGIE
jgi:lysosomal acid lipase/cholesteryl ester hydrolase